MRSIKPLTWAELSPDPPVFSESSGHEPSRRAQATLAILKVRKACACLRHLAAVDSDPGRSRRRAACLSELLGVTLAIHSHDNRYLKEQAVNLIRRSRGVAAAHKVIVAPRKHVNGLCPRFGRKDHQPGANGSLSHLLPAENLCLGRVQVPALAQVGHAFADPPQQPVADLCVGTFPDSAGSLCQDLEASLGLTLKLKTVQRPHLDHRRDLPSDGIFHFPIQLGQVELAVDL
mmetsp:Transcript_50032/g.119512  ORF Transcript_50032/g.119512 Transcript_50032/m.119512 type:complete len:232 (+) Transcript_50032:113-808(+)